MSQEQRIKSLEQDIAAINSVVEQWQSGTNSGNAAGVAATSTRDAVLMPPHSPAVLGEAIRPFFQEAFFDLFRVKVSLASDEIQILGDRAFRRGTFTLTLTPKSGGEDIGDQGKYLEIWERQTDGSWKIARDIWNSDKPLPGQ